MHHNDAIPLIYGTVEYNTDFQYLYGFEAFYITIQVSPSKYTCFCGKINKVIKYRIIFKEVMAKNNHCYDTLHPLIMCMAIETWA